MIISFNKFCQAVKSVHRESDCNTVDNDCTKTQYMTTILICRFIRKASLFSNKKEQVATVMVVTGSISTTTQTDPSYSAGGDIV